MRCAIKIGADCRLRSHHRGYFVFEFNEARNDHFTCTVEARKFLLQMNRKIDVSRKRQLVCVFLFVIATESIRHSSFVICWSSSVAHHVCTEWLKFRVISVNWIIIWLASDHYYHITANGNRQPSIEHFRQYKMHCDVWHVPTTHWLRLQRRNDAHSHIRICNAWCVWTFDSTAFPPMQHTH